MKKIYTAVLLATFFIACTKVEKEPLDYYPKVQTVSAFVQSDGSVLVKGQIADEGADLVQYIGFCMDTLPEPKMLNNQVNSSYISQDGSFTDYYDGFDINKKYYFRAWAANGYGYSYGNIITLDSIEAIPVVAPCNPPVNTLSYGGGQPTQFYSSVSQPIVGINQWEVTTSTGAGTYYYIFGSKPTTRIYTTTTNSSPAPDEVYIYFYSGAISGTISDGAPFYVNQTGIDTWNMTLCSAPWLYTGSTFHFTTKFVCPL